MGFFKSLLSSRSTRTTDRIYLDYASSTPLDRDMLASFPRIADDILQANPSALHKEGQQAKSVITSARQLVATTLQAHADEIIFTSNATESDNIAMQGIVRANSGKKIAIITTDTEHAAILETIAHVADDIQTIILETEKGVVDVKQIVIPEDVDVVLVSVMYVNNEIGVVQDIQSIAKRIRYLRKHHPTVTILFHTDATQAPLHYILNVQKLGIDMMTLGATKLYCPKGVGILYVKRGISIMPIQYGGGQEFSLRPGTETVQLIHDVAHSLAWAQKNLDKHTADIATLKALFESHIAHHIPAAVITASDKERTPHISHIAIKNFDSELLVLELDARGIAVSAKSACKNEDANESSIVERIYGKGWSAIRVSFGRMTKEKDIEKTIIALKHILEKYRQ